MVYLFYSKITRRVSSPDPPPPVVAAWIARWASQWQIGVYRVAVSSLCWDMCAAGHRESVAGKVSRDLVWRAHQCATSCADAANLSCRSVSSADQSTWQSPVACCCGNWATHDPHLLWLENINRCIYYKVLLFTCTWLWLLTVLAHQHRRTMATRFHIHHNAGILFGKVHQMVFDKVAGWNISNVDRLSWLCIVYYLWICCLPHASTGAVVLAELECNALQLANVAAQTILEGRSGKARLEKQMTIWHF